jgi:hypothetical protein
MTSDSVYRYISYNLFESQTLQSNIPLELPINLHELKSPIAFHWGLIVIMGGIAPLVLYLTLHYVAKLDSSEPCFATSRD